MQIKLFKDFRKPRYIDEFSLIIDLIGIDQIRTIVKRICKSGRTLPSLKDTEALDLFYDAFPFLRNKSYLNANEIKQIKCFISLITDMGVFYEQHGYAPQRTCKQLNNIGKRYNNFRSRHSLDDHKVTILNRYLGLDGLPEPIKWHETKTASKLRKRYENLWAKNFNRLEGYFLTTKTCYISSDISELSDLRAWCYRQLNSFNNGNLSLTRMESLRSIGFFDVYGKQNNYRLAA